MRGEETKRSKSESGWKRVRYRMIEMLQRETFNFLHEDKEYSLKNDQ